MNPKPSTKQPLLHLFIAIAGAYLFYQNSWGLSGLIFSLIVFLIAHAHKNIPKAINVFFLITACLLALYGSSLSIILWLLSQLLFTSHYIAKTSWPTALLQGLRLFLTSGISALSKKEGRQLFPNVSFPRLALLSLPPLGLSFLFYGLYTEASPTFANLFSMADINLPPFSFFALLLLFFYLGYAYILPYPALNLQAWDDRQSDWLTRQRKKFNRHPLWLKYEYQGALLSLTALNILLLTFHFSDLSLLLHGKPAAGLSYSEWVHQGIGALIFSIVLASSLLLFVFRANLNFFSRNKPLKLLAITWVVLNIFLVISCFLKNSWYIEAYGLTYKRIGVYVYLLLALIGLVSTAYKVWFRSSFFWVVRTNFRLALWTLLLTACFPWARIITAYNLQAAEVKDYRYLLSLPDHNTDLLLQHIHHTPDSYKAEVKNRKQRFIQKQKNTPWQGLTLIDEYAFLKITPEKI